MELSDLTQHECETTRNEGVYIYIYYGVGGVKIAYLGRPCPPFKIFKE